MRKKPCEFCEENLQTVELGKNGHACYVESYPENYLIAFISFARDENEEQEEISMNIPFSYCPSCGRRLI